MCHERKQQDGGRWNGESEGNRCRKLGRIIETRGQKESKAKVLRHLTEFMYLILTSTALFSENGI